MYNVYDNMYLTWICRYIYCKAVISSFYLETDRKFYLMCIWLFSFIILYILHAWKIYYIYMYMIFSSHLETDSKFYYNCSWLVHFRYLTYMNKIYVQLYIYDNMYLHKYVDISAVRLWYLLPTLKQTGSFI